jgi:hypothetical protein
MKKSGKLHLSPAVRLLVWYFSLAAYICIPFRKSGVRFRKGDVRFRNNGEYGFERMVCGFVDHCRALRMEFLAWPNSLNASGVPAAFKIKINK